MESKQRCALSRSQECSGWRRGGRPSSWRWMGYLGSDTSLDMTNSKLISGGFSEKNAAQSQPHPQQSTNGQRHKVRITLLTLLPQLCKDINCREFVDTTVDGGSDPNVHLKPQLQHRESKGECARGCRAESCDSKRGRDVERPQEACKLSLATSRQCPSHSSGSRHS